MIKAPLKTNREWLAAFAAIRRAELAYTPRVLLSLKGAAEQAEGAAPQPPRRRRPPSWAEQQRRKAWGRQWGSMIGAYWQARRAAGYTTGRR